MAKKNNTQIILATGAILGLDALRAAAESKINSVKMITRKPPNALSSAPYVIKNKIDLNNLPNKIELYRSVESFITSKCECCSSGWSCWDRR